MSSLPRTALIKSLERYGNVTQRDDGVLVVRVEDDVTVLVLGDGTITWPDGSLATPTIRMLNNIVTGVGMHNLLNTIFHPKWNYSGPPSEKGKNDDEGS